MADANTVETDLTQAFRDAFADVAAQFADELGQRGDLTAAAFRVSSITSMWRRHVTPLLDRVMSAYEQTAQWLATSLGHNLPPGWTDLPGRAPSRLPAPAAAYRSAVADTLESIGQRLGERARAELAKGLDSDESPEQLRDRLRAVFSSDGPQLGPSRAERVARTEATRVWNAAVLDAAHTADNADELVKVWSSRADSSVRPAHRAADGQTRPLNEPFTVGGVPMAGPGDPAAPPELSINCRCRLQVYARTGRAAAYESMPGQRAHVYETQETPLVTPTNHPVAAASGPRAGAMIALMPSAADATRLALDGGEPADQLHLTLWFLGEGADWDQEQRADLIAQLRHHANYLDPGPVHARAFGAAQWNATSDTSCWVWSVGDARGAPDDAPMLNQAHSVALDAVASMDRHPELPAQHSPWQPHVRAAYSSDPALLPEMNERLGPITFDRLRVAFEGNYTDIPLTPQPEEPPSQPVTVTAAGLPTRSWSTPDSTAIAFENQQTGDGRLFAPEALYWDGPGPWPLQYADEMLMGHEGAELAGAIHTLGRDGDRITATGVLYLSQHAGADAAMLLEEGAPLGVSVDLDDVDIEVINTSGDTDSEPALSASLPSASVTRLDDGALLLTTQTTPLWTAAGAAFSRTRQAVQIITGPSGRITATVVRDALASTGAISAAAGDPDPGTGTVLHTERSGDTLLRITRGRVRGATLVAMPAYDQARIVLDPLTSEQDPDETPPLAAASKPSPDHQRVVEYVTASPAPVGARIVAQTLGITMKAARGHLCRAVDAGRIVRLAPGLYIGATANLPEGEVIAAMSGDTDLPIHTDRAHKWDGDAAASRVLNWATSQRDTVDSERLATAFLWRDPDINPATLAAYKLGIADVFGDELHIVPRAVFAVASVLQGGRGGVDIPEEEQDNLRDRVTGLYRRMADEFDDPTLVAPWEDPPEPDDMDELAASAWSAMRNSDPMPSAWFRQPTEEELPPGSGGVHYKDGRIYGWVAQAGEPHAGFSNRNLTIESLGDIDTTHFLRAHFPLDDGTTVKAGAFTMNVGHHRDGAECETSACQFDDTRTVAGIITVGMNDRGMWFSGAAAPWLSEWDRNVFSACQPSYHMKQGRDRRWQLRAVLSVPVPGHSSPLLAAAVAERANLALAASAHTPPPMPGPRVETSTLRDELVAALTDSIILDELAAALQRRETERDTDLRAEVERIAANIAPTPQEITASATRKGR